MAQPCCGGARTMACSLSTGEWWRLISYQFLHVGLLHIGLNMWVLWSVGRLTERLYGRLPFLTLYILSGIGGALLSIAWGPTRETVGASGAIFGVLGAFLGYLSHARGSVPRSVFRAHWLPTVLFVVFNIGSGAVQPLIDNSVHIGGLILGFLLGWMLARPLTEQAAPVNLSGRAVGAGAAAAAIYLSLLWFITGAGSQPTLPERFLTDHPWYSRGENLNLQLWQSLAQQAGAGTISSADWPTNSSATFCPSGKLLMINSRKRPLMSRQIKSILPAAFCLL